MASLTGLCPSQPGTGGLGVANSASGRGIATVEDCVCMDIQRPCFRVDHRSNETRSKFVWDGRKTTTVEVEESELFNENCRTTTIQKASPAQQREMKKASDPSYPRNTKLHPPIRYG